MEHEVIIKNLDPRHDGLRIAQLTDVHCGRITPREHIRAAVALANRARPDLVVMTGDYVNWRKDEVPLVTEQLGGLEAEQVVCTLGNHDYFADGDAVAAALLQAGYTVLRNQHTTVEVGGAALHLVGIDDPVTRKDDIPAAFARVPEGGTRVVLCHCPEKVVDLEARGSHLVLSGHTHGGQIWPFRFVVRMFTPYVSGLFRVQDTWAYVSRGTGYFGPPLRVAEPSEITKLVLRAG